MTVAFVGLSHLGIVSSIGWASLGEPTLALDSDANLIEDLQQGRLPIYEPGLEQLLSTSRAKIDFSCRIQDLATCDAVIISRDVPTSDANLSDLAPIQSLIAEVLPHLRPQCVLVIMSQVSPGFCRKLRDDLNASRPDLQIRVLYWVETLIFGRAVERFLHPERLIIGSDEPAANLPESLSHGFQQLGCTVLQMKYESAELTKTAINLFLAASVTYANTLADVCEVVGADWCEMIPALQLDGRIGPKAYLQPSLGFAGGNLERDLVTVQSVCRARGVDAGLLDEVLAFNYRRYHWVVLKVRQLVFGHGKRPVIGLWGLTYKKDTHSTKNSPALQFIRDFHAAADIRAWDPAVTSADVEMPITLVSQRDDVLDNADALVIMNDWTNFSTPDVPAMVQRMRRPLVIDCSGVLLSRRTELGGIEYSAMGL